MNISTHRFFFLVLFYLSAVLLLAGCSTGSRQMTSAALHTLVVQGKSPIIVDVRSEDEYASGHIPGAIHIPFYSIGKRHEEISRDKDVSVVVYCAHGPRAWWAAMSLRRLDFTKVITLTGSFRQWQKSGFDFDENKL